MNVLITGANGFIGSYLARFLLEKGNNILACARQFHESTRQLLTGAEFIEMDVLNTEQLNSIVVNADIIIHTSTANDIISKNTLSGIELSAIGTKNLLGFAVKNNIPRCIVFSTLQVYGTELTGVIDEKSPLNFQNDYAINHLYAEMYAEMYTRLKKVQCVSVRPSNVYGRIRTKAFNRWSLVPGCFCKEAIDTGTITIKSSGKQMRNFVNLQNLSMAIECIMQHFPDSYENYNLASSEANTMADVAAKVKKVYEENYSGGITINITGTEPSASNHFVISLDKLKEIGFTENKNFTLETEIAELFNYLQTNRHV
jgi:UDP-glucose 4-epimerase